ncbi:hypothetical protein N8779_03075 [Candidatus Pelagibacter ubique]|nr:hypothetical protein [Candidatus Pelagibacter ubique]
MKKLFVILTLISLWTNLSFGQILELNNCKHKDAGDRNYNFTVDTVKKILTHGDNNPGVTTHKINYNSSDNSYKSEFGSVSDAEKFTWTAYPDQNRVKFSYYIKKFF